MNCKETRGNMLRMSLLCFCGWAEKRGDMGVWTMGERSPFMVFEKEIIFLYIW